MHRGQPPRAGRTSDVLHDKIFAGVDLHDVRLELVPLLQRLGVEGWGGQAGGQAGGRAGGRAGKWVDFTLVDGVGVTARSCQLSKLLHIWLLHPGCPPCWHTLLE